MANIKASIKDIRRIARLTEHNRRIRSRLKTLARKVRELSEGDDAASTRDAAREYIAALDKAAKTGIIHPNKASRHKSACARFVS